MTHDAPSTRPRVRGAVVDDQTRCVHYRTEVDIVAIRFACCGEYYPCHLCHEEATGHPARRWPVAEHATRAVLCGACGVELPIEAYLDVDACPACGAAFNPRCRLHTHLYFETSTPAS
ncbi:CHY zinc finger protein [Agromyces sp. SYSU T0242]|uniref:CHY zinc finger protein n=1 Tax=Agromyces litoreus TaxID=3158561 RepID=UPI00339148E1